MISLVAILLLFYIAFLVIRLYNSNNMLSSVFLFPISIAVSIYWGALFASYKNNLANLNYWVIVFFAIALIITLINWRRWYLNLSLFFILAGAISAALCRHGISFVPVYANNRWLPPYLPSTRSEQLTREIPERQMMVELIDVIFPLGSKLALDFRPIVAEYIFFGDSLNKKCYPLRDFAENKLTIPPDTDFLIYSEDYPLYKKGDSVIIGGHERYGTIFYRQIRKDKK